MKFYKLSADRNENGHVYASGYGPLEGGMPFLPNNLLEGHKKYWEIDPMKAGIELEKGRKRVWPDFLQNGFSPPMFFISENIVRSLEKIGVKFYRLTEMPIGVIKGKWHQKNTPPNYYVAEIKYGGIEQDFAASGYDELDEDGRPTNESQLRRPTLTKNVYISDTWNGKDLFSYKCPSAVVDASTILFCTEKVKELGEKAGWVNVKFDQLELI